MPRLQVAVAALALSLVACATPPVRDLPIDPTTELDRLFSMHFEGFEPPDPEQVRSHAIARLYPGRSFDDAWTATLLVLMQDGILVRASRASGVIVCANEPPRLPVRSETGPSWFLVTGVPEIILIDAVDAGVWVHANWLHDWYRLVERPQLQSIDIRDKTKETLASQFHDLLQVEISAKDRLANLR